MLSEHWQSITTVVFCTIGLAAVVRWLISVKQTTLVSVASWSAISFASILAVEVLAFATGQADWSGGLEALRFAAATSTLCPFVAKLGAKRPQHRGWQFVVLTLWLVLALPAVESLVVRPGQPLVVAAARSWFIALLIAVGLFDRVLTRFAGTALLAAAGQTLLLAAYLPLPLAVSGHAHLPWLGVALIAVSVLLEACQVPRRRPPISEMDKLWLDFRDDFGTLWGLRILERVNAAAQIHRWDLRLTWLGFQRAEEGKEEQWPSSFHTTLTNLLRRFVGSQWIASRIGKHIDC